MGAEKDAERQAADAAAAAAVAAAAASALEDDDDDKGDDTQSKKRKDRLEQNRISARESRKRKKTMIEELQRTVITLSRENKDLNERNEQLRRQLVEVGTKYPNLVPLQAIVGQATQTPSGAAAGSPAAATALAGSSAASTGGTDGETADASSTAGGSTSGNSKGTAGTGTGASASATASVMAALTNPVSWLSGSSGNTEADKNRGA